MGSYCLDRCFVRLVQVCYGAVADACRHVCVPLQPFSVYVLRTGIVPFHE